MSHVNKPDASNGRLAKTHSTSADGLSFPKSHLRSVFCFGAALITTVILLVLLLIIASGFAIYFAQRSEITSNGNKSNLTTVDNLSKFLHPKPKQRSKDVRLPLDVLPFYYNLSLKANIYGNNSTSFSFSGSVNVHFHCKTSTDQFFVHAHNSLNVNLSAVQVNKFGEVNNLVSNITFNTDFQWLHIQLRQKLKAGLDYSIYFPNFQGPLTVNLKGWYLSTYVENSVKKYLVTSQLQPTDARRVFPCWDEPVFKAKFQIYLWRRDDYQSLSNMPILESRSMPDRWVIDVYAPTLNTSTYLLAFVVCQFASLSGVDAKGRNFTIWARPDLIHNGKYAQEIGRKIIAIFETYFEIDYPMNKTDMIAIPHFSAGAMENWGLITYRESSLLFDTTVGTVFTRQRIATIISHEIAHQWFGNLVTMNWWDDLWLNEGFATFMEYIGVSHAEPDWYMDEQFSVLEMQRVLATDSLIETHPVSLPVHHPDEINEIFDTISYQKGASLLRMTEAFLGSEIFRHGLKTYLMRHKFKNTESTHLWNALSEASEEYGKPIDVERIMKSWIMQAGYPVVTINRTARNTFKIKQERFMINFPLMNISNQITVNNTWNIPLTYASKSEDFKRSESRIVWMNNESMCVTVHEPDELWFVFNLRQTGFYRVNYDQESWHVLSQSLLNNHFVFPTSTRAQLLDDSFNIANQGSISFKIFLELTQYLRNERDYFPLKAAQRAFNYLYSMLLLHEANDALKRYVREIVDGAYQGVDWEAKEENHNHISSLTRQTVVSIACEADHTGCISKAKMLFKEFMDKQNVTKIPSSLRRFVYCSAIRWGGDSEWSFLYDLGQRVENDDSIFNIFEALGCTRDLGKLRKYIYDLVEEAKSEKAEVELPHSLNNNPLGLYFLWDTMKREWLNGSISTTLKMLFKAVDKRRIIIDTLPIKNELEDMLKSANEDKDEETARSISKILIQVTRDALWIARYRAVIYNWIEQKFTGHA